MKKISYKSKLLSLAIATLLSTGFAMPASAKNGLEPLPLSFSYVGTEKDSPAFKLSVFNADENQFTIEVYDQTNVILYSEVIKGNSISKKFLLSLVDLKDAVLSFKVTGNKTGEYSIYEIDCNTLSNKDWTAKKVH